MESESKRTVRKNVAAILEARGVGLSCLINNGVSNGSAQRTMGANQDITLATLDVVAKALKVKPWDLLVPAATARVAHLGRGRAGPLTDELLAAVARLGPDVARRHENAIRAQLDMSLLPPLANGTDP